MIYKPPRPGMLSAFSIIRDWIKESSKYHNHSSSGNLDLGFAEDWDLIEDLVKKREEKTKQLSYSFKLFLYQWQKKSKISKKMMKRYSRNNYISISKFRIPVREVLSHVKKQLVIIKRIKIIMDKEIQWTEEDNSALHDLRIEEEALFNSAKKKKEFNSVFEDNNFVVKHQELVSSLNKLGKYEHSIEHLNDSLVNIIDSLKRFLLVQKHFLVLILKDPDFVSVESHIENRKSKYVRYNLLEERLLNRVFGILDEEEEVLIEADEELARV
jgi:hypothetical protein